MTLSRLAAYILKYEVFEMEVKRNYEIIDFKYGEFIHFHFSQLLKMNVHIYFNIIRAGTTCKAGTSGIPLKGWHLTLIDHIIRCMCQNFFKKRKRGKFNFSFIINTQSTFHVIN